MVDSDSVHERLQHDMDNLERNTPSMNGTRAREQDDENANEDDRPIFEATKERTDQSTA